MEMSRASFLDHSMEVSATAERISIRPQRARALLYAAVLATFPLALVYVVMTTNRQFTLGGYAFVGIFFLGALAIVGISLRPTNRLIEVDLAGRRVRVGKGFGLGQPAEFPLERVTVRSTARRIDAGDQGMQLAKKAELVLPGQPPVTALDLAGRGVPLVDHFVAAVGAADAEARRSALAHLVARVAAEGVEERKSLLQMGALVLAAGGITLWWFL